MKLFISIVMIFMTLNLVANCENKNFSFKVKSTKEAPVTLLNVLDNLTQECKMNLVVSDEMTSERLNKSIGYMNISNYTFDELLTLLISDNNLFYTLTNNEKVIKVSYLQTKTFNIDYVSFSDGSSNSNKVITTGSEEGAGSGTFSMDFTTKFKFWDTIKDEISSILNRDSDSYKSDSTFINQDAGVVTVTGTKKQIERVESYIDKVTQRLHKQILIDAKIIEVKYNDERTLGIDWSKFEATFDGNRHESQPTISNLTNPNYLIGYNFTMQGLLKFLKSQGDVSIVSNPKILTLNNQPAVINVGEQKNYKYSLGTTTTTTNGVVNSNPQYEVGSTFVGVTLNIVAEVTGDNFIILKVNPTVSEISEAHLDKDGIPSLAPDIKVKQLSSIVKVKNEKRVLLGGLIQKRTDDKETKVPLLGNIPLLGRMFKSNSKVESKSEMVIVLTPTLVRGDEGDHTLSQLEEELGK